MTTTGLVILILILYIGAMVAVGLNAKRRIKNFDDAISARGQTTMLMIIGSTVGMQIGSGFVIGGAEYGATYGIGGSWYGLACGLNHIVIALLICKFAYSHKYISVADYFGDRYGGKMPRVIYSVASTMGSVAMLSGQLLAGKAIFTTLGIPENLGVAFTAIISLIYSNVAGLWGTMAISTIQSAVIFTGMVSAFGVMLVQMGMGELAASVPASYFDIIPFDGEMWVSIAVPSILSGMVAQGVFQSVVSAKEEKAATRGYVISGLILLPIALIPALLGMFGRVLFPDLPAASVFMQLLLVRTPLLVGAIVLAAIVCAILGSCNTAYLAIGVSTVHIIYKGLFNPDADTKTCKRLMLGANLVTCVVAVLLALRMNDIIQVMNLGFSMLVAGCLVPFLGGRVWKRANRPGALAASVVGMGAVLVNTLDIIHLPYVALTSLLLSTVAFVVGSLLISEKKAEACSD